MQDRAHESPGHDADDITPRAVGMLVALCVATFFVTTSGTVLAPFLQAIASDVHTSFAAVANLFSVQAVPWGAAGLILGAMSDRVGRRRVLAVGALALGATRLGFAGSQTYAATTLWQVLSGLGGGAFMGSVFAVVSDHVPPGLRGRAFGWVITGQSLALVLGVPLITFIGSIGGWRGAIAAHGALTVASAVGVWLMVPADLPRRAEATSRSALLPALAKPQLFTLLAAGTMERMCFAIVGMYLATYLQQSYHVSLSALALGLALVALGNLIGNVAGGHLADRLPRRRLTFAATSVATAVFGIPLMMWQPGLGGSLLLGFAYSCANALGRPALIASVADTPVEIRGAVLGLNVTMASLGWLLAAAIGGLLVTHHGFSGLGVFAALTALTGAALAVGGRLPGRRKRAASV